jgi:hypothetical protein
MTKPKLHHQKMVKIIVHSHSQQQQQQKTLYIQLKPQDLIYNHTHLTLIDIENDFDKRARKKSL